MTDFFAYGDLQRNEHCRNERLIQTLQALLKFVREQGKTSFEKKLVFSALASKLNVDSGLGTLAPNGITERFSNIFLTN